MPESNDATGPGSNPLGRFHKSAMNAHAYQNHVTMAEKAEASRQQFWGKLVESVSALHGEWVAAWDNFGKALQDQRLSDAVDEFTRLGELLGCIQQAWCFWRSDVRPWVRQARELNGSLKQKRFRRPVPENAQPEWIADWALRLRRCHRRPVQLLRQLSKSLSRHWANSGGRPEWTRFEVVLQLAAMVGRPTSREKLLCALQAVPDTLIVKEVSPALARVVLPNPADVDKLTLTTDDSVHLTHLILYKSGWPWLFGRWFEDRPIGLGIADWGCVGEPLDEPKSHSLQLPVDEHPCPEDNESARSLEATMGPTVPDYTDVDETDLSILSAIQSIPAGWCTIESIIRKTPVKRKTVGKRLTTLADKKHVEKRDGKHGYRITHQGKQVLVHFKLLKIDNHDSTQ